ncbi:hypothetical protein IQ07DRAFT_554360 [Pyrenochaeta sp. DS3sAY3a]|nr:hypothetical protein IQ07DRAFT_554360 [Pyrenochaeta sp. DS3sAY3a]
MDFSQNFFHAVYAAGLIVVAAFFIRAAALRSKSKRCDLTITQLYIYPIKGVRGMALQKAHVGPYGFQGDRTFALQRVHRNKEDGAIKKYETLLIGHYLQLALFLASVDNQGMSENAKQADLVVQWKGRGTEFDTVEGFVSADTIRFPLCPETLDRPQIEIDLHGSNATAFDMGDDYAQWFTERLGFETRLAYIGNESRPVLGTIAPNSKGGLKKARVINRLRGSIPFLSHPAERLVFNDIAHYLVVTEESNKEVSSRLNEGFEMDVRKFRPNVVVKGSSNPFVEDYWGELTFDNGIQMPLTANCYRCQSITVDFDTGKKASDDRGLVWKKINKDRRVDAGAKYSPVFGRYGYCFGSALGSTLEVGQTAFVSHVNSQRTKFDWPNLTTFGVDEKK